MDHRRAERILEGIEATSLHGLRKALAQAAVRYAHIRATWQLSSMEERAQSDAVRSAAHNALIDACNILSRNMAVRGEDVAWRQMLSDHRKEIGDFACHVHAILGIRAR